MIYASTSCLKGENGFVKDVFKVLELYKKLNIQNIELGSIHNPPFDEKKLVRFQKESSTRFIVHGFFPPAKNPFMLNLGAQDEKLLRNSINFIKNAIEFCSTIEAGRYSFHGAYTAETDLKDNVVGKRYPYTRVFNTLVENINAVADFASEHGVRIAVENSGYDNQVGFLLTKEQVINFFQKLNHRNVGFLLDLGHLNLGSELLNFNKKEFIKATQKYIFEIHCHKNDGISDQHLNMTDPDLFKDFDKEILKKCALTLEATNLNPEEILEGVGVLRTVAQSLGW